MSDIIKHKLPAKFTTWLEFYRDIKNTPIFDEIDNSALIISSCSEIKYEHPLWEIKSNALDEVIEALPERKEFLDKVFIGGGIDHNPKWAYILLEILDDK